LVSNAVAVPQIKSEPIMINIRNNEKQISFIKEILKLYINKLGNITFNAEPNGLIDTIINILKFLIGLINNLIEFIYKFMQIGALILALISALKTLIDVIGDLIEWFQNLFNPENTIAIK
jgi:hypothetical protein